METEEEKDTADRGGDSWRESKTDTKGIKSKGGGIG